MYQVISPIIACYQRTYVADLDVARFKFDHLDAKFYQDIFKTLETQEKFDFQDNYMSMQDYIENTLGEKLGATVAAEHPAEYEGINIQKELRLEKQSSAPAPLPRREMKPIPNGCDPSAPPRPPKRSDFSTRPACNNNNQMNHIIQNSLPPVPPRPAKNHNQNYTTMNQGPEVPSRKTSINRSNVVVELPPKLPQQRPPVVPARQFQCSSFVNRPTDPDEDLSAHQPDYLTIIPQNDDYSVFSQNQLK